MFSQLALSTVMVLLTVSIHGYGIALLGRVLHKEVREEQAMHLPTLSPRVLIFTLISVLALFALHGIEIWLYAFVYLLLGAIGHLETAVYYSTLSYAAIGYSDQYVIQGWRLMGAIEGINGVLLLGWSTAFFVTMVARLGR